METSLKIIAALLAVILTSCDPRAEKRVVIELADSSESASLVLTQLEGSVARLGFVKKEEAPKEPFLVAFYTKALPSVNNRTNTVGILIYHNPNEKEIKVRAMEWITSVFSEETKETIKELQVILKKSNAVKAIHWE